MNPTAALPGSMTWMGIRLSSGSRRPRSPKLQMSKIRSRFWPRPATGAFPLHFDRGSAMLTCRSETGRKTYEGTHRAAARHFGSFDPTDAGARTAARLGHFGTGATDVERCAADSAGIALSGAAPPGAPRMDQSSLGHVGQQPARQIL